jgi:hypothetical protein
VFTGCALPFHSGVYVAGHFNDLAAVAILPRQDGCSSLVIFKDFEKIDVKRASAMIKFLLEAV